MSFLRKILRHRRGATAIEYALIASLIAIAAITAFRNLGGQVNTTFSNVHGAMSG
ncbi:MAG TPA: Flp family type IVb pilin [Allosphingosinicella sp.]|jgi:pilus assembly protein Flp/PilA